MLEKPPMILQNSSKLLWDKDSLAVRTEKHFQVGSVGFSVPHWIKYSGFCVYSVVFFVHVFDNLKQTKVAKTKDICLGGGELWLGHKTHVRTSLLVIPLTLWQQNDEGALVRKLLLKPHVQLIVRMSCWVNDVGTWFTLFRNLAASSESAMISATKNKPKKAWRTRWKQQAGRKAASGARGQEVRRNFTVLGRIRKIQFTQWTVDRVDCLNGSWRFCRLLLLRGCRKTGTPWIWISEMKHF